MRECLFSRGESCSFSSWFFGVNVVVICVLRELCVNGSLTGLLQVFFYCVVFSSGFQFLVLVKLFSFLVGVLHLFFDLRFVLRLVSSRLGFFGLYCFPRFFGLLESVGWLACISSLF